MSMCSRTRYASKAIMLVLLSALTKLSEGTPATPHQFDEQLIDHFGADTRTYSQRYYENSTWWGGPGHPIICIMGGEGEIKPSTGIFYPWVTDVIAKELKAYVVEPEHRFYGTSLPFGPEISFNEYTMRRYFTPQQAMADAAYFIQHIREKLGCSTPSSTEEERLEESVYCPVITIGGSYPGWLSAMMRFRYPAVVDIAYSASAPMTFYTQEVDQFAYYQLITESAEKSVKDCSNSVREAIKAVHELASVDKVVERLDICTPLPEYLRNNNPDTTNLFFEELDMVIMYTFANLNMANNPPDGSSLQTVCQAMVEYVAAGEPIEAIKYLLHGYAATTSLTRPAFLPKLNQLILFENYNTNMEQGGCFDLETQMPAGKNPTISGGDWSGCGNGRNGQSWDFQTCTFLVEKIGTNGVTDMFHPRNWTIDWLNRHCASRFDVTPQPKALVDLWGFDDLVKSGASYILFTNGLNDGWSVGGIQTNLSSTLLTINIPDGAHHSELSHYPPNDNDTEDVRVARESALTILKTWLEEVNINRTDND